MTLSQNLKIRQIRLSMFWSFLTPQVKSEHRKFSLQIRLSTFWYYLWRQKRSERPKSNLTFDVLIFDVLFGLSMFFLHFRHSDFWRSDPFPCSWRKWFLTSYFWLTVFFTNCFLTKWSSTYFFHLYGLWKSDIWQWRFPKLTSLTKR